MPTRGSQLCPVLTTAELTPPGTHRRQRLWRGRKAKLQPNHVPRISPYSTQGVFPTRRRRRPLSSNARRKPLTGQRLQPHRAGGTGPRAAPCACHPLVPRPAATTEPLQGAPSTSPMCTHVPVPAAHGLPSVCVVAQRRQPWTQSQLTLVQVLCFAQRHCQLAPSMASEPLLRAAG